MSYMNLRRITMKVRPAVDHPTFWDWQAGFLNMWLFSESDDDAVERADTILSQLPYESVEEGAISVLDCDALEHKPEWRSHENAARQLGFSLFLSEIATGTDEGNFETMDAP
jgi:hypothetical protein